MSNRGEYVSEIFLYLLNQCQCPHRTGGNNPNSTTVKKKVSGNSPNIMTVPIAYSSLKKALGVSDTRFQCLKRDIEWLERKGLVRTIKGRSVQLSSPAVSSVAVAEYLSKNRFKETVQRNYETERASCVQGYAANFGTMNRFFVLLRQILPRSSPLTADFFSIRVGKEGVGAHYPKISAQDQKKIIQTIYADMGMIDIRSKMKGFIKKKLIQIAKKKIKENFEPGPKKFLVPTSYKPEQKMEEWKDLLEALQNENILKTGLKGKGDILLQALEEGGETLLQDEKDTVKASDTLTEGATRTLEGILAKFLPEKAESPEAAEKTMERFNRFLKENPESESDPMKNMPFAKYMNS